MEDRMESWGGSAAKGLKVEVKIGWGVLTLSSGGKLFLTVEGATLWVFTEFPNSWEGGGLVGRRGRGGRVLRARGVRGVLTSRPDCPPWSLAAASTSALTRGTRPSGRTSGPEKTGGLMGSS